MRISDWSSDVCSSDLRNFWLEACRTPPESNMDFRLTPDQEELRSAARDFARAELPAIAAELERENKPPSHELVRRYAEMGFLGINIPAELGGLGLGNLEALTVLEEFAKISSAVAFPIFESSVGPVRAIRIGRRSVREG